MRLFTLAIDSSTHKRLRVLDLVLELLDLSLESDSVRAVGCALEGNPDGRLGGLDIVAKRGPSVGVQFGLALSIGRILGLKVHKPGFILAHKDDALVTILILILILPG
jgi:hypothetical protein